MFSPVYGAWPGASQCLKKKRLDPPQIERWIRALSVRVRFDVQVPVRCDLHACLRVRRLTKSVLAGADR